MDNLPPSLILEVLSRLADSSDLARCRLTCKTLKSLSYAVGSIKLFYSFDRYTKSRSSATSITPFKSIVIDFVAIQSNVESISIGVDESLQGISYDDVEDESDDLHLTDVDFVSDWLPLVSEGLKMLSFSDFWIQSCWRRSRVLSLISRHCQRLHELEVKNAWLSVDGLSAMSSLTSLTLEFVRIDDENLSKVNECFPCLQILNLLGVGGLKDPKISLQHLKSCQWTVSNAPLSLTIVAPEMIELKLKCVKPRSLVLKTPLLSDFHLTLEKAGIVDIGDLPHLKNLWLKSGHIRSLLHVLPCARAVNYLSIDSPNSTKLVEAMNSSLDLLFDVFPNLNSLNLGPGAYSEMETSFQADELEGKIGIKGLTDFTAYLLTSDVEVTVSFISFILDKCNNLSSISLLVHQKLDSVIANNLISRCVGVFPRLRWKLGIWKEGCKDVWVSDIPKMLGAF